MFCCQSIMRGVYLSSSRCQTQLHAWARSKLGSRVSSDIEDNAAVALPLPPPSLTYLPRRSLCPRFQWQVQLPLTTPPNPWLLWELCSHKCATPALADVPIPEKNPGVDAAMLVGDGFCWLSFFHSRR